jgi:hypothetical protein
MEGKENPISLEEFKKKKEEGNEKLKSMQPEPGDPTEKEKEEAVENLGVRVDEDHSPEGKKE